MIATFGAALGAGLFAAVNPCGFAMLPAYLSYFVGLESEDETNTAKHVLRGLAVALTMTLGFVLVFGIIGLLAATFISSGTIESRTGYFTFPLGVLLAIGGVAMAFFRYEPKISLPRMNKGTGSRELPSIFLFGVSYAVVSLSCTFAIFSTTVVFAFTQDNFATGMSAFIGYAAGMGLVITVLTVSMAVGRTSVARNLRRILPHVNRISGVFLILAGAFLALFGWWEIQVARGNLAENRLVDDAFRFQARVQNWIDDVGDYRLTIAALFILGGILLWVLRDRFNPQERRLVGGAFVLGYLLVEFVGYQGEFMLLPLLRTIADLPERIANWFSDPIRWPVAFELLAAALLVTIVYFAAKNRRRPREAEIAHASQPG